MADDSNGNDTDDAVVVLADERRKRKRYGAPALPDRTGVAQIAEVAPELLANLRQSNLSDATIEAARLFAVKREAYRQYGFRCHPNQTTGLMLPYFEPDALQPLGYRMRPHRPIAFRDRRTGKQREKKYDQVAGTGLLVYCPPLPSTLEHRAQSQRPLYWTEGEKKALYLAQLGSCAVGLSGVDCWHDTEASVAGHGRKLHPFILEHYAVAGREHIIAFDADARDNPNVQRAMATLAGALIAAGAASVHACLPPADGPKGIDDYGHSKGDDAALALLERTREPIDPLAPSEGCLPLKRFALFEGSGAEHLRLPEGYDITKQGALVLYEGHEDDEPPREVLPSPIVLTSRVTDVNTGEIHCGVTFRADGRWVTRNVPRVALGDRTMLGALRPLGAPIDSVNLQHVVRYFTAFETLNESCMRRALCVSRAGWQGRSFALRQSITAADVPEIEIAGGCDDYAILDAVGMAANADLSTHLTALRTAFDASETCAMMMLGALAAPLLHMLGVSNFVMHLCGDTTRGKTTVLRIAASIYGNPYDCSWVGQWNSTPYAIEKRAALLCDLPLCLDESGAARDGQMSGLVYMLANGAPRARAKRGAADGVERAVRWRTVVLSTGESELADERAAAGTHARVINLPMPADSFAGLDGAAINALVRACAEHYGALGRWWLEFLVRMSDADRQQWREVYANLVELMQAQARDRMVARQVEYFAVLQLVELALAQSETLGREGGQTVWDFVSRGVDDEALQSKQQRVVIALSDWVAGEPACFPLASCAGDARTIHGYRSNGLVSFIPTSLKAYLRTQHLSWDTQISRDLASTGILIREPRSTSYQNRITVDGRQLRVYTLALP